MGFKLPSETLGSHQKAAESRPAPFLIHQESNVIVRHSAITYVRTSAKSLSITRKSRTGTSAYRCIRSPGFQQQNKLYTGEIPLFSHYQIESQIDPPSSVKSVCRPVVPLLSTARSVNRHRHQLRTRDPRRRYRETAFNTNLEAADEIARQLRLVTSAA